MIEAGLIASRWLHYAAVTTLFGFTLFGLYAPRTALVSSLAVRRTAAAALLALASGVGWFVFAAATMAGSFAEVPATLPLVAFQTDFGPLWGARLMLALGLCLPALRRLKVPAVIVAGALLASLSLTGHARLHEGGLGWLHMANDSLHLLAAGTWLGALTAFLVLLFEAPDDVETGRALRDFSGVGVCAVTALGATGVLNGWLVLGRLEPVITTRYGWLLMLKVALFGLMLALAALNRFHSARAADPATLRGLRRRVLFEQALGLGVLLIVSALGTLDPTP